MPGSRPLRLVAAALRCYPRRWRRRHGDEAAELAALLMRDGMPARSIAWSYVKGAAAARLLSSRGHLGAAAGALLAAACSLGVALALLAPSAPASAASMVRLRITRPAGAAAQLRALLRAHHFDITVTQEPVSPGLAGSIITFGREGPPRAGGGTLGGITGPCPGGAPGCTDGIVVPAHFGGAALIVVGRAARPGERYAAASRHGRPG